MSVDFFPEPARALMQLRAERELASDEEVLTSDHDEATYAQGFSKASAHCVGSGLPCTSGVGGGDLCHRVERIMTQRPEVTSLSKKITVGVRALLVLILSFGLGVSEGRALQESQSSDDALGGLPVFEVAAIKPSNAASEGGRITFTRSGLTTTATSLVDLIKLAYGVEGDQISGLTGPALKETYDVDAKVSPIVDVDKLTPFERRIMVRSLLAERFGLKVHVESKRLPAYVLLVGKRGSKLIEDPPDKWGTPGQQVLRMVGKNHLVARGVPMEGLIRALSDQLERPVIDGTGLTKNYDFSLIWSSDDQSGQPRSNGEQAQVRLSDGGEEDSLFSAVRDQLGLKLEKQKGSVEGLVVDHCHRPSNN